MAVFKCKMCGGDLYPETGSTTCECEFCGTVQTVPTDDGEKKTNLFNRANRLRMNAEFDKAAAVYESIAAEFPEEAEAYWGLCLCAYGIEYVDDPATGEKKPTCHRTLPTSIMEDSNFEQACDNADAVARRVYREEAKAIDRIQKDILSIVANETPYDVFICYKETADEGGRTEDSVLAQEIYDALTGKGLKVFFSRITLEDKLGQQYEPYIYAALSSAKVMLAIGTKFEYYDAVWVKNEWMRFLSMMKTVKGKALIPCYKDLDAYDMPKEFKNLQGQDMGKLGWLQDLTRGVMKLCGIGKDDTAQQAVKQVISSGSPTITSLLERAKLFLEDRKWKDADLYADKVLDIEPKNAEAYFLKFLAEHGFSTAEQYSYMDEVPVEDANFQKVIRFADFDLKKTIDKWNQEIEDRIEKQRKAKILEDALQSIQVANTPEKSQEILDILDSIAGFEGVDEARDALVKRNQRLEQIQDTLDMLNKQFELYHKIFEYEEEKKELGLFSGRRRNELENLIFDAKQAILEIEEKYNDPSMISLSKIPANSIENEIQYRIAIQYYNAGLLAEASEAFMPIMRYKDVQKLVEGDPLLTKQMQTMKLSQLMSVGSYVCFGHYQQDEDEESTDDVEWIILDTRKDKCLMITKNGIEVKPFNNTLDTVTWESSSLRAWLNDDFLNTAFNKDEQKDILITKVSNDPNQGNKNWNLKPEPDTDDKVFLLSYTEAMKYFTSKEDRVCRPTEFLRAKGFSSGQWWLRSQGREMRSVTCINGDGSCTSFYADSRSIMVRPCLWMDLTSIISEIES